MRQGLTHAWLTADATPAPRPVAAPAGRRIAVLAPHPDDEVLGCGATLVLAGQADRHTRVGVLYLTDGERGARDGARSAAQLAARRRVEASRALAVLGLDAGEHAGFADGALAAGGAEVARVAAFVEACAAELVMVPAPLDPHPDHRACAQILAQVLVNRPELQPAVWLYEVQPAFPMNALVRTDETYDLKARALAEHRSQDAERLASAALGLASCRGSYAPPGWTHAEAFRIGSAAIFIDLCRALWPPAGSPGD